MSLLFFAGGECLTRHGVLVRRTSIEENVVETHTRSGTSGWSLGSDGVLHNSDANVPRVEHVGGVPYLLLEDARTNLILQSGDFATTWASTNVTVATNVAAGLDGTTADRLTDNSAAAVGGTDQTITIPDDSEDYCASVYVHKTSHSSNAGRLFCDVSGGTGVSAVIRFDPASGVVSPTTGSTTPTASGVDDAGTHWRFWVTVTNNGTGNVSGYMNVQPSFNDDVASASSDVTLVGNCVVWGAQYEQGSRPSALIPTTTVAVTRNADTFYADFPHPPRELTTYVKVANYRAGQLNARLFHIGGTSDTTDPRLQLAVRSGADIVAIYDDGTTTAQTGAIAAPADGVTMEFLVTLSAAGVVDLAASTDAAAQVDVASAAGGALPAAWAAARLYINSGVATRVGVNRYASVKVAAGTKTMAEMRAL